MVLKKLLVLIILFVLLISSKSIASRILDHETETFIISIIDEIKYVNNIDKDIKFKIISSNEINAFIDQNNIIYITSGLIQNCDDYVALLAVIAHEIGHIDKNHIIQRKLNISRLKNYNNFSTLSIIAGSMISGNAQVLQGLALTTAGISDLGINFSKDQEREADYYSLKTLNKLNLYSNSIINLLEEIERKGIEKGLTKEKQRIGTHPYFEERIDIINYLKKSDKNNFDNKTNNKFKFIQSKFLGYSGNVNKISELEKPFKIYANSILNAKEGDLKNSLKKLNKLILKNNNIYLVETKADILFSYGYINESVKFYEKVIQSLPKNYYAQIRIFENTNFEKLSAFQRNNLFKENLNLLEIFFNNKNILLSYLKLAKLNKNEDWIDFLQFWIDKENDLEIIKNKLKEFKKTDDKDLVSLIDIIYNKII